MKENTKFQNYRFVGKINVDEVQPWFEFASSKPWDDEELPWMFDNKVRREILIKLADGPATFDSIYNSINFSPKPLLIEEEEYNCKVSYQWTKKTVENHLMNLEWYDLIKLDGDTYELMFPILKSEKMKNIEKYTMKFAENWIKIIKEMKDEINSELGDKATPIYEILIENTVEKLYKLLKNEGILPNTPNIKALWAEQLRSFKFGEWVKNNF